jgi:DNA-binding GntR family transcriptional regulator
MKKNNMNKTQYVYNFIRSGILDGVLGPGHRIIIDQIAKELGCSIIPVREAIRRLESDGLVQCKPYSGAIVSIINEKEYVETLSVLAVLEGYATSLSSRELLPEDIRKLEALNEEMKRVLMDFEFEKFGELNEEFHQVFYEKCSNEYLKDQIKHTTSKMNTLRHSAFTFVPQRSLKSIEEHAHIITLIKEKASFKEIEEAVRQHKLNTIEAIKNRQKTSFD